MRFYLVACAVTIVNFIYAQSPWPAEAWANTTNLSSLHASFGNNLSGAHWNPVKRQLWLANNSGNFLKLEEDGLGSFSVTANWVAGGDLEGITQANLYDTTVFLIDEHDASNKAYIKEFDVRTNGVNIIHTWDITSNIPAYNGSSGPEGIVFVPDNWLAYNGFRDKNGNLCTSVNGMGGLMFVAHQNGGNIYVFDLNRTNNTYTFVGEYATNRSESADLAFDRTTGYLYIWHNPANTNFLELVNLSSVAQSTIRKFTMIKEYNGPIAGNLEGFALTPASTNENWIWITVDDNSNGTQPGLRWFKQDSSCIFKPFLMANKLSLCINESITFTDTSLGLCGGENYSWDFGTGALPATASGKGPHTINYSTSGSKNITLKITGSITDSITKISYVNVNALPVVGLLLNPDTVCLSQTTFSLSGGSPTGGIYAGTGISGGNFNPSFAGIGQHQVVYSYTNTSTGCADSTTSLITVDACSSIETHTINNYVPVIFDPQHHSIKIISSDIKKLVVYDITGRIIFQATDLLRETTYTLHPFLPGVYFIATLYGSENNFGIQKIFFH